MLFLLIILSLFVFLFWISKPRKQSGIILYFANIGTGKTTYLSKLAIEELKLIKKGKSKYQNIVSNAIISGVTYIPDIRKLLKTGAMQKTLILVDEGSIVYNNRQMNLTELEIQYFKLIRHYSSTCIVLSQSYNDIDVTLRRLYTEVYLMRYLPFFTLIQPITKRVGIDEISKQIIDEYMFKWPFSWRLFLRPIYFKYFNSWWIPDNVSIINFELDEFKARKQPEYKPKKWFGLIKESELEKLSERSEEGGSPSHGGEPPPQAYPVREKFFKQKELCQKQTQL